jgi:hypothetical protein
MQRASLVFGLAGVLISSSAARQTPKARPEFDAAHVRVNNPGSNPPATMIVTNPRGNECRPKS